MATPIGLRQVKVFKDVVANKEVVIDNYHGNYGYIEVTNDADVAIDIVMNDNPAGGVLGVPIPVAPKTTRPIPLVSYTFKATGVVTVVAYGM